ncbi:glycosyltransferase family 4 protein [Paenibacillus sp. GD4]|jgi:glycosyltransferase involved in cell wall biosynthesis|uniref:glycosyltransferase family 4 protein n=1 Tax=Paenibacillus sp. GD4 TaxID=3068890 RepID=UPI0027965369|nr:glycosyltransferase family 4 protein [Paenibacillus sp. GD4]MDQ1910399.1 glycosyltransferase family 4 protein [Paenibacillus sp. GD4]
MRICMVSEEEIVGPSAIIPGGIGQYILRYTRMLAEKGHEVTILCQSKSAFQSGGSGIRWVGLPRKGKLPWDVTVFFWLRKQRFDIVEFPEWGGHGAIPAMLLPKKAGRIITRGHGHNLWVQRVHGQQQAKGKQHYKEWLQVHFSSGVLANSEFLKEEFVRDFGLQASRIDVCHIGIDPHAIGHTEAVRKSFQGPTLIYVGGMDRRKGAIDLVRILPMLKERLPELRLILLGQDTPTGPNRTSYREYLMDTARQLGVFEQIEFIPATPRTQLHQYYGRASVFVSASRAETLGIPFLEAMSTGLPVVTWRTGAAPELVRHGEDGFLYELDDKEGFAAGLLTLLTDPKQWSRMSEQAVENVRSRFMEKDILERQVAWYHQISG